MFIILKPFYKHWRVLILSNSWFVTDTKMASPSWSLRGELHELEILLQEFAFSSSVIQPCNTRNLDGYRPYRAAAAFALSVRPTRTVTKLSYLARLSEFLSFFLPFFFFYPTDRSTFTRERAMGNETFHWDGFRKSCFIFIHHDLLIFEA